MRFFAFLILFASMGMIAQAKTGKPPSFEERLVVLDHEEGLIDLYQDAKAAKAYFVLPAPDPKTGEFGRYIYTNALTAGLGSNPVGLDRGSGSGTSLIALRLMGNKLIIEAENTDYRATANNPAEQNAVRDSFARSILWSGPVSATAKDGRVLVNITSFLVRDASLIADRLEARGQGKFRLDLTRSTMDTGASLAFPENMEFDAYLTFASDKPGPEVRATTAVPQSVTLIQHHSFIKLPDDGYRTRNADPRAASIYVEYADYSAPLSASMTRRLARRFRLEKTNPELALSPVKKPIIYYVDNATPEPVRSALIEGISWWTKAFEAAGFKDAFRVEVLPEGVNPLDARYNIVQWAHRQTRGWSYGGGIADPRTGEMIKAMVTLGSLRVRQDRLIFEGLLGAQKTGTGDMDDPVELALARIRQLGAHEVGHTLGFQHNMAASTIMGRASVMDYPAPEIDFKDDGTLDVSHAYGVGIGAWDKFTVNYLYSETSPGQDEKARLEALIRDGYASGLRYVADQHSRPAGAGHPYGSLWDTGTDPVASLRNTMKVRAIALKNFGLRNLQTGEALSDLQAALVPLYLYHRYQVEAATKPIGGFDFNYSVKGDGFADMHMLDPAYQREALHAVLATVSPTALDLPDALLNILKPRVEGQNYTREMFQSTAHPAFDTLGAAQVAAKITFGHLLHPARAGRLVEFNRRDPANPSLEEMLETTTDYVFAAPRNETARLLALRHGVQIQLVDSLLILAGNARSSDAVKAITNLHLAELESRLQHSRRPADKAVYAMLVKRIERYINRPGDPSQAKPALLETPPGSPIGMSAGTWEDLCWLCLPQ